MMENSEDSEDNSVEGVEGIEGIQTHEAQALEAGQESNEGTSNITDDANSVTDSPTSNSVDSEEQRVILDMMRNCKKRKHKLWHPTWTFLLHRLSSPQLLRHSFSRMLVFDVRFLAQDSIYPGPRLTVSSVEEIHAYRAAILRLFAQNLLAGRTAYWRSFAIFFEDQFRAALEPAFLHGLFEPPQVTIEEILTRVNFHRECDSIFPIDDETELTELTEDKDETAANKKVRSSIPANSSLNVSARSAANRIIKSSFTSPNGSPPSSPSPPAALNYPCRPGRPPSHHQLLRFHGTG